MRISLDVPGDLRAAETARRALSSFTGHVPNDVLDTLCLVVNELVTNSLLHACMNGEVIGLTVELDGKTIRGSVSDPGHGFKVPERPGGQPKLTATSGRGLFLVDRLSKRWGVDRIPQTSVWFEMSLEHSTRPVAIEV